MRLLLLIMLLPCPLWSAISWDPSVRLSLSHAGTLFSRDIDPSESHWSSLWLSADTILLSFTAADRHTLSMPLSIKYRSGSEQHGRLHLEGAAGGGISLEYMVRITERMAASLSADILFLWYGSCGGGSWMAGATASFIYLPIRRIMLSIPVSLAWSRGEMMYSIGIAAGLRLGRLE